MKASILLVLLLCSGCAAARLRTEADEYVDHAMMESILGSRAAPPTPGGPKAAPATPATSPVRGDRKTIFHGSLLLQVPDPGSSEKLVRSLDEEVGGWIHGIQGTTFTLRIPADHFHSLLNRLTMLGNLINRTVTGTDVTEEYLDLEIRIKNSESVRKRLIALLEKVKDVKEALSVERELARVTGEIERMKGRLKYLKDQVAFSTLTVTLQRTMPVHVAVRSPHFPFPWIHEMGIDDLFQFRNQP